MRGDEDFAEIQDQNMPIEHFVDLDGQLIIKELCYDEESETMPADLTETV